MNEQEGSKQKKGKEWRNLLIYIVVVIVVALLVNQFILQKVEVEGPSMQESLYTGDQLLVEKVSYRFHDPELYDVIVFRPYEQNKDTLYIKRVIGVEGDFVQIKDGKVYVNQEPLEDPQGEEYLYNAGLAENGITVGEDEYFVLGDNRYQSVDSRDAAVGLVKRSAIVGKACLRVWPLNKLGVIK